MSKNDVAPFLRASAVAPVFMSADVAAALRRFDKLGFVTRAYREEPGAEPIYGFICYGPGELHIGRVADLDPSTNTSACYLYVEDADAVRAAWEASGVGGRLLPARDTPYGLREFAYIDPDGNLIRVGSELDGA